MLLEVSNIYRRPSSSSGSPVWIRDGESFLEGVNQTSVWKAENGFSSDSFFQSHEDSSWLSEDKR
jgi:hypothetical protein